MFYKNKSYFLALNKMGDYHYYGYGGEATLDKAIEYYAAAAKLKFPQVYFILFLFSLTN